jgi:hypothetical protein
MLTMMRHKRAQAELGTGGILIAVAVAALCVLRHSACAHGTWAIWHPCALDLLLTVRRFEVWRETQSLIYEHTSRELGGDASARVAVKPLEVQHQVGRQRCKQPLRRERALVAATLATSLSQLINKEA